MPVSPLQDEEKQVAIEEIPFDKVQVKGVEMGSGGYGVVYQAKLDERDICSKNHETKEVQTTPRGYNP